MNPEQQAVKSSYPLGKLSVITIIIVRYAKNSEER